MISRHRWWTAAMIFILPFISGTCKLSAWEQSGVASWYGGIFQGRQTANGETYDTYGYTCAHKTLPFGTVLDVTNVANGRTVRVRVNDRGPFVDDRIIDLTYAAARDLDMIRDGTANVRIAAVEDGIPETVFTVQIGAWGDLENAAAHRKILEEAGLKPTARLGSDGVTRISMANVAEDEIFSLVGVLENLGYADLFIFQQRTVPD